ncbi:hypothetical protein GUI43_04272 [Micromonospora noduli]|nr:hypothetical protein [Micromonospora noduli]RAO07817.1 hypothetical protein GUI43_04272 [Micromonospora noduli]
MEAFVGGERTSTSQKAKGLTKVLLDTANVAVEHLAQAGRPPAGGQPVAPHVRPDQNVDCHAAGVCGGTVPQQVTP